MSAIATRESPSLTEYKPQGLGHILKLSAIVTAGSIGSIPLLQKYSLPVRIEV